VVGQHFVNKYNITLQDVISKTCSIFDFVVKSGHLDVVQFLVIHFHFRDLVDKKFITCNICSLLWHKHFSVLRFLDDHFALTKQDYMSSGLLFLLCSCKEVDVFKFLIEEKQIDSSDFDVAN